jgi:hypothetical protein
MINKPDEVAGLLVALGRAGVELAPHPTDPARLRHRPANLPPDLTARLRLHRGAILTVLASGYAPDAHADDDDAAYVYGERLGVAEGLGLATHAGSAAWLVAVGESMDSCCHAATRRGTLAHGSIDEGHSGGGEGER